MLRVVVVVLLVACGDNKPPLTVDEFVVAYDEALCDWRVRCGLLEESDCSRFVYQLIDLDLAAAINAGIVEFNPEIAHACVNRFVTLGCNPTTAEFRTPACFGVFRGTLHDGESCAFGTECISGECWLESGCDDACCTGICTGNIPATLGRIGDRCRHSDCVEGYCDGNVCLAFLPEGSECDYSDQCDIGLSCDGTCKRLPVAGEPCTTRCRDIGLICSRALYCEPYPLAGRQCFLEEDCSPYYGCIDKKCSLRTVGDACQYGRPCAAPAVCNRWSCVAPQPSGKLCYQNHECASGRCDFRTFACIDYETCI